MTENDVQSQMHINNQFYLEIVDVINASIPIIIGNIFWAVKGKI